MGFALLFVAIIVTFFIAVIKPKGFLKKYIWLAIWFFVWFGDIFISEVLFKSTAKEYAKTTIYEKPKINAFYEGDREIFLIAPQHKGYVPNRYKYYLYDLLPKYKDSFNALMNGNLEYIDYKEVGEHPINNGKYFRVYVDNNNSTNCFMNEDIVKRYDLSSYITNKIISYDDIINLYEKYYDESFKYTRWDKDGIKYDGMPQKEIDLINYLYGLGGDMYTVATFVDDYIISLKRKIDDIHKLYDGRCVARKKIQESEISRYEFVNCISKYGSSNVCNVSPDIENKYWSVFYYGGYIKDRTNGKIVAGNIYAQKRWGMPFSLFSIIGMATSPFSTAATGTKICGGSNKFNIDDCNELLVKEFFKKDNK